MDRDSNKVSKRNGKLLKRGGGGYLGVKVVKKGFLMASVEKGPLRLRTRSRVKSFFFIDDPHEYSISSGEEERRDVMVLEPEMKSTLLGRPTKKVSFFFSDLLWPAMLSGHIHQKRRMIRSLLAFSHHYSSLQGTRTMASRFS